MAEESNSGLPESESEPSSVYEGDLTPEPTESPESDQGEGSESPETGDGSGQSASQSGDSETDGIFTDLEKDIPEVLKHQANNVKKKMQKVFTQKTQAISKEVEALRKSQITPELQRDYTTLYTWYDKLQKDPQTGFKELASQFGVSLDALVGSAKATATEVELDPGKLETREDFVNFARQEIRKAVEEVRVNEVNPLKQALSGIQGGSQKRENIERGARAVEEAKALPGFSDDKGQVTEAGSKAIAAVLRGEFTGPDALKKAHYFLVGQESQTKVQKLQTELINLKKNVRGAGSPPDDNSHKTVTRPSSPGNFWSDLSAEPLRS